MPMQYPVLDNRPIDQWRVTELREELRRRKIITRGLKEELVKRLDEAIRNEKESVLEGELNNAGDPDSDRQDIRDEEGVELVAEDRGEVNDKSDKTGNDATVVDTDGNTSDVNQGVKVEDVDTLNDACLEGTVEETIVNMVSMEDDETGSQISITQSESCDKDSKYDEKHEDWKPAVEDFALSPAEPENQGPEVSPDLGFQVNCDSISADSVSINEKNKLKDNLNADNFHLELEVIKPEMVQPSSSNVPPIVGEMHPVNDDKEPVKNQASLEEIDAKYGTNVELSTKDDSADGGSPEKLNLDRSSGDESMEEDVIESKHIECSSKFVELGERSEVSRVDAVEDATIVDPVTCGFSPDKKDIVVEEQVMPTEPFQKRKLEDNEVIRIHENSKRQRRWNTEAIKVPELQSSNISSSSTPKDSFHPIPKRTFARSDSTLSGDSPKERVVPPSQKTATNSLRIDRFLRPFTLKAVQELLAKTGTVCSFWMDHIKTHCYVTYLSTEEAIATRNSVYNLQWPPNGGRLLTAEFVDPQEVKMRAEAPPQSPAPISPSPTTPISAPPFQRLQPPQPTRQDSLRQKLPPPPPLPIPPPPPLSDPPTLREPLPPPPPPPAKKQEPPVLTLDDLFKKTRATPRIYYLYLPEEQVAAKLSAQGKSTSTVE